MQDDRPISVLVLYTHPLLGEGLTDLLANECGLEVTAVQMGDGPEAAATALAAAPQVVIFERGEPDRAAEILESVPDALVIDVAIGQGPTFAYRREEISALPEAIVAAIRQVPVAHRHAATPASQAREVAVRP
jgi:DNA-binding NarL/FixJ family response regulator